MRAITVRQPYASLLMLADRGARKHFETRGYRPRCVSIGEEIAIHAGRVAYLDALTPAAVAALGSEFGCGDSRITLAKRLPVGQIIGLSRLVKVLPADDVPARQQIFGDYSAGRFAWRLEPTLRLAPGIVCGGQLGLWTVPAGIERYLASAQRAA